MQTLRIRPARDLAQLLDVFGSGWGFSPEASSWMPKVDAFESEDTLTVRYELAGFSPQDLEATLQEGYLTVKGTRQMESPEGASYYNRELATGSFTRTLRIPDQYDESSIRAVFSNGLLEVTISKRPEVLPKNVEIEQV